MARSTVAVAFFAVVMAASAAAGASGSRSDMDGSSAIQDARSGQVRAPSSLRDAPKGDVGFLTVTTDPPAKLSVDGADTGKTTPVTKLSLPAGKHKVTLTSLDGKTTRSLGVTIVAGEEKRLTVSL